MSYFNFYKKLCYLSAEKLYLPKNTVDVWLQKCVSRSQLASFSSPTYRIINDFNNIAEELPVSHFYLYSQQEYQTIWKGEDKSNGVHAYFSNGDLVIEEVDEGSSGEESGLKEGDVILTINQEHPSEAAANYESGDFLIERKSEKLHFKVETKKYLRKEEPFVKDGNVLRVRSFRSEFFDYKQLYKIASEFKGQKDFILDMRSNKGGNLVAGLRLLSFVLCREKIKVGAFKTHRYKQSERDIMPDSLSDADQLHVVQDHKIVELWTERVNVCFPKLRHVIVNNETASTAEMVTDVLQQQLKAKVHGLPTAGRMHVSEWNRLDWIPGDVWLSVPIAFWEKAVNN